ncbi:MAG: flagellar protein [Ammonifex sp.]|jgi:flagellar operon protein|nr:MAG: flagellar protein [Ammonifex sp.]
MVEKIAGNRITPAKPAPATRVGAGEFKTLLQAKLQEAGSVQLSAHAEKRLRQRNINLTVQDLAKIKSAIEAAASKGTREVLLVYGELSLIASTANKTVITAVAREPGSVFTNIDGAVIIR